MTTPPQPPRPPDRRGRAHPGTDPVTRRLPRPGAPDARTERLRPPMRDTAPTERMRRPAAPPPDRPVPPQSTPPHAGEPAPRRRTGVTRRSGLLLGVIVVAALAGGLAGAELYARHRADDVLVGIAECVVEDGARISYGVNPPFLWQHLTGRYTNISVHTAGDRVQSADGMTADVTLEDVRLQDSADSKGTIGSLSATLTWRSDGIRDTAVANLPAVGELITGVRTDPAAGTLVLDAGATMVTAKPVVTEGDLNLEVVAVDGPFPKDVVQGALDDLTRKLNDNYPLGIHADSVQVTDAGVVGTFSSQDASIPREDANACFAPL
ncbi:LmeA family phospholipid-binding protein [Mycobacterium sp. ZZG]